MERDKYKLEKGYYLVWSGSIPAAPGLSTSSSSTSSSSSSSSSSTSSISSSSYTPGLSIDICELTIGADGWVFSGTRTVKRYKESFHLQTSIEPRSFSVAAPGRRSGRRAGGRKKEEKDYPQDFTPSGETWFDHRSPRRSQGQASTCSCNCCQGCIGFTGYVCQARIKAC